MQDYCKRVGSYKVFGEQHVAIHRLYRDILRVTSLSPSKGLGEGRGTYNLVGILESLSAEGLLSYGNDNSSFLNNLCANSVAQNINVDNAALPDSAGLCDPASILPEPFKSEFLNGKSRVKVPPPDVAELPLPCYKVSRKDERALRKALLRSNMASLFPESNIAQNSDGSLLLSGVFGVLTKGGKLRFIFDRRCPNSGEHRLHWVTLPHGTQFCHLVVKPGFSLRGSGTDLSKYFYRLKECEEMLSRNCFGRRFDGGAYSEFGGVRGCKYRLCLGVVAMGSLNAVDVATKTHLALGEACGGLPREALMEYGKPLPKGALRGGAYVDDLLLTLVVPDDMLESNTEDHDCMQRMLAAYPQANLPIAAEKGFGFGDASLPVDKRKAASEFVAWGTSVSSKSDKVGAVEVKRLLLALIVFYVISQPIVYLDILEKLVGFLIHPVNRLLCISSHILVFYIVYSNGRRVCAREWLTNGPPISEMNFYMWGWLFLYVVPICMLRFLPEYPQPMQPRCPEGPLSLELVPISPKRCTEP